jgi:hypothetical protein
MKFSIGVVERVIGKGSITEKLFCGGFAVFCLEKNLVETSS